MFQLIKRVFLFALLNLLIIISLSLILHLTGLDEILSGYGGYSSLFLFCLFWGTGGAFISLALSKYFAKAAMGVQVIDPHTSHPQMRQLVARVHELARKAQLPAMPEVGIYQSPELNAFATGPSKSNSLVAVSTGLLQHLNEKEVDGVLGHEVAHIANGDMVTMTIIQGVVNAFVMFFAKMIAQLAAKDSEGRVNYAIYFLLEEILYVVFMFLAIPLVTAFSRMREFRADKGGARYAGKQNMIDALKALQRGPQIFDNREASLNAFKISGKKSGGLIKYFMTHPPLEERIRALERAPIL